MSPRRPGRGSKPAAARSSNRLFVVFGVVAGLGLLYGWNTVFLGPKGDEAATVKEELATARQQEQDLRRQLGQLQKVAAETQAREAEIARLGRLIPSTPDVAGAILALDEAAKQAGVAWSSFTPSLAGKPSATGPEPLSLSIRIGGSFPQIFDYLARLEALDRLVVVDGIALAGGQGSGQAGSNGQLSADIRARMFSAGGVRPGTAAAPATPGGPEQTSTLAKAGG